jgi:hypothetical protein
MGQDDGHQWDTEGEDRAVALDHASSGAPIADRSEPVSFDGYDLLDVPLGDLLRGERATLGKSLLDVERELRIRATYIAAIENGDVGAFQSPGFIAGYVRSYARYMGIDPEWTFRRFCEETGFRGIHGSAQQGNSAKRILSEAPRRMDPNEVMSSSRISFAPTRDSIFHNVEPGALGSIAVLAVIAVGVGYGAWAILNDIQRLNIAPIDEAPLAPLAQLDPLAGAVDGAFDAPESFDIAMPLPETGERIFRPQALEAPVLTPRDGALSTLNPDEVGTLGDVPRTAPQAPDVQVASAASAVQVTAGRPDQVTLFATRPTWLRVYTAEGATIYEATLNAGDSYVIPEGEATPLLRTGNAGSTYFAVNGVALGPAGPGASIARDVEMTADAITTNYQMADTTADPDLTEVASLVFEAAAVPDVPVVVPEQPTTQAYNPTGPATTTDAQTFDPALAADVVAAIIASNALPVVVQTPDADTERPLQRP